MQVLHLTAHMGGGVGKALSGLVAQSRISDSGFKHIIVCLEQPEKSQFVNKVRGYGGEVIVCPDKGGLEKLVRDSDIVQLEWWNHPATIKNLCLLAIPPIRLLTWCHVSGLHNPIIPQGLILSSQKFLFTSPCSFESKEVRSLLPKLRDRFGVVSSSGGFSGLPEGRPEADEYMAVGYIGSLNFAKLNPRFIDYLAAVRIPGFRVRMIGDLMNQDVLNQQCDSSGKKGMLEFRGYTSDIVSELSSINVLAYLLNPEHYGTTENALLEAMAMAIVPIVLDNPAERQIIHDHTTGLIVHSPGEFAEAIEWLSNNPIERQRLGNRASKTVRKRFPVEKMETTLRSHYHKILSRGKRKIVFSEIFGTDPAQWFLSCQRDRHLFNEDGSINADGSTPLSYGLFENTKGTVFHFHEYFPENMKLKLWAKNLKSFKENT